MSDQTSKPEGESAPFSAQDAMAFMQRIWNPFAMPMPGSASGAVTPSVRIEPAHSSTPAIASPRNRGHLPCAIWSGSSVEANGRSRDRPSPTSWKGVPTR